MRNSTAIRECDEDTVRIITIKRISKLGISFLSDLGRPGKSYNKTSPKPTKRSVAANMDVIVH